MPGVMLGDIGIYVEPNANKQTRTRPRCLSLAPPSILMPLLSAIASIVSIRELETAVHKELA